MIQRQVWDTHTHTHAHTHNAPDDTEAGLDTHTHTHNAPDDTEAGLGAGGVTTETEAELALHVRQDEREVVHRDAETWRTEKEWMSGFMPPKSGANNVDIKRSNLLWTYEANIIFLHREEDVDEISVRVSRTQAFIGYDLFSLFWKYVRTYFNNEILINSSAFELRLKIDKLCVCVFNPCSIIVLMIL